MPENITAENLLNNIIETLAEGVHQQKTTSSMEEERSKSVSSHFTRLFGRQKPVHTLLGGGKCKISLIYLFLFHSPSWIWLSALCVLFC